MLSERLAIGAKDAAERLGMPTVPVLTYLANSIRFRQS